MWVGSFAVWSYSLLHPWDIQIWEAVPLPKDARHVPMNALVASRVGRGVAGLMRLHGIQRNAPRSSKALARRLRLQEVEEPLQLLQELLGQRPLGRVWMPQPAVHLSAEAGAAFRMRLLTPKALGSGMEAEVQRVPLDEVGRLVGHRLLKKERLQKYAREGRARELLDVAADGNWEDRAPIRSVLTLKDKNLF